MVLRTLALKLQTRFFVNRHVIDLVNYGNIILRPGKACFVVLSLEVSVTLATFKYKVTIIIILSRE